MQDNVIYCQNFVSEINYLLENNYKNQKVLLVTTFGVDQLYDEKINQISKLVNLNKLVLSNDAKNSMIYEKMLLKDISEDTSLIIVFGSGNVCDLVKSVATDLDLKYIVIPSLCSAGGYALNYVLKFSDELIQKKPVNLAEVIIIDNQIIAKSPYKMIAGCYGGIISVFAVILDIVFMKTIYNSQTESENVLLLENILKEVSRLPSNIIKTSIGVTELFKQMIEIEKILNNCDYFNSSLFNVTLLAYEFGDYSTSFGELSIVTAMLLVQLYDSLFEVNNVNKNVLPNINKRISKLRQLSVNYSDSVFDDTISENRDVFVFKFMSLKDKYKILCQRYMVFIDNAFKVYKSFYNDKGMWLKKSIKNNVMINAIAVSPDVYEGQNILRFMRNFGLLDIN